MKLDTNLAWKQASSVISANREVVLALAGVFFLLPNLAFGLFLPQPEPAAGASQEQIVALTRAYYLSALPFIIPMALVQATGTLAILTLFTDRTRPTVGEAIRLALGGILGYLAAQLLLGIAVGVAGGFVLGGAALTKVPAVVGLALAALVIAAAYILVKTSLVGPIIAVERIRGPVAALVRSWRLMRGNSVRAGLFYLLVGVVFLVVISIALALAGIVLAVTVSGETARVISTVISSALGAVMTLYFVAILAAVHRQLAGNSPESAAAPFE